MSGRYDVKYSNILQQEVTYNAKEGSRKTEAIILIRRKIKGFRGSECGKQSKKINITVPSVAPSSFQSTNDVCVFRYMLRVKVNVYAPNIPIN